VPVEVVEVPIDLESAADLQWAMQKAIGQAARQLVSKAAEQAAQGKPSLMNAILDFGKPHVYEVTVHLVDEREKRGPTEVPKEPTEPEKIQ
jgi:hypothetical protein